MDDTDQSKRLYLLNKSKKINKTYNQFKFVGKSTCAIFLASNHKNKQLNAIKIFPKKEFSASNFISEYKIANLFNHPNIIKTESKFDKIMAIKDQEFECFGLVMEFAPYGDLFQYISRLEHLNETLVRSIFHRIVSGVEYLHSKLVCHLDLKIENIVFGHNFQTKIIDFGHSKLLQSQDQLLSAQSLGTSLIKPPETWTGQPYSGFKIDVFGLGVILFAMLAGVLPFESGAKANDPGYQYFYGQEYDSFYEHVQKKMCEQNKVRFNNPELRSLLNAMLNDKPGERPSVEGIKEFGWMKGPVHNEREYGEKMRETVMLIKAKTCGAK